MTFLTLLQNDGSVAPPPAPQGGHFLPIYELRGKPKRKAKKLIGKRKTSGKPQVVYRITREQLEALSEAISHKIPDNSEIIKQINAERFAALTRIALKESEIFGDLKKISEFILADALLMAQLEQTAKKIKQDLINRVQEELDIQQLFLQLIIDDII